MGLSKTEEFAASHNELARWTKAMAHPARIAILEHLIQKKSCICGDIVDELPLSQSTVSQHLQELKKAGLIQGNIEGPRVCYCIDAAVWNRMKGSMNQLLESFQDPACC
ncbi:MAG: metalloregulator ArsR/SmtB family transcription factor [Cytophagales bacterium]|nr:metalloregulator ArsR/SmtB family transcription factor [Cytophagales bacterium]